MVDTAHPSPIEIWLTQHNMEVICLIAHEDETTEKLEVDSLSLRGAQREMTGYLLSQGYEPAGRWENGNEDGTETSRQFKYTGVIRP